MTTPTSPTGTSTSLTNTYLGSDTRPAAAKQKVTLFLPFSPSAMNLTTLQPQSVRCHHNLQALHRSTKMPASRRRPLPPRVARQSPRALSHRRASCKPERPTSKVLRFREPQGPWAQRLSLVTLSTSSGPPARVGRHSSSTTHQAPPSLCSLQAHRTRTTAPRSRQAHRSHKEKTFVLKILLMKGSGYMLFAKGMRRTARRRARPRTPCPARSTRAREPPPPAAAAPLLPPPRAPPLPPRGGEDFYVFICFF